MKAFKTAKGNLDSYDEERKKVDMDSTRAKRVLGAYLKYKKLFIETSSMEAMDSSQSVEAQKYQTMSSQYLKSYQQIKANIKRSYGDASKYQEIYNTLSGQHEKMAADVNSLSTEVTKINDALTVTQDKLEKIRDKYEDAELAFTRQTKEFEEKHKYSISSYEQAEETQSRVRKSKTNYFQMMAMAKRYSDLSEKARRKSELNSVKHFNYDRDQKKGEENIEEAITKVALLQRKYQSTAVAASVFMESCKEGGCDCGSGAAEALGEAIHTSAEAQMLEGLKTAEGKESEAQCMHDNHMALMNMQASKQAQLRHDQVSEWLKQLRKEHQVAVDGAATSKVIEEQAKIKAERYLRVAKTAKEDSLNPCEE
jgi:hypothetical protein